MESKWVWALRVLLMFVLLEGYLSQGCLEEERVALLELKHFFNRPNRLKNWVDRGQNSDCCKWESLYCNEGTGRIRYLDLKDTRDLSLGEWYLNASLFAAFEELDGFDLSNNHIAGFVDNRGFDKLSRLRNLNNLQLRDNMFNNSILSYLGVLSALGTLNLENNGLNGIIDISGLGSFRNLEFLDMSSNKIDKIIFPKGLMKLKTLNLRNVSIHDGSSLLQSLGSFPTLEELDLSFNNFSESTHSQEYLNNFTSVEELYLDGSSLHVSLLQSIGAFTSLRHFSMQRCQIDDILSFKGLDWSSRLSNLEILYLGYNMFNNSILLWLGAFSSLEKVHLNDNRLKGVVDISGD